MTRSEVISLRLVKYESTRRCKRCKGFIRYAQSNNCVICHGNRERVTADTKVVSGRFIYTKGDRKALTEYAILLAAARGVNLRAAIDAELTPKQWAARHDCPHPGTVFGGGT